MDYGPDHLTEAVTVSPDDCKPFLASPSTTWIDVVGFSDVEMIRALCTLCGVHPLAVEDLLTVDERPKSEDYDRVLVFVTKTVSLEEEGDRLRLDAEHGGLLLLPGVVLTFQEHEGDPFDTIRRRIREHRGQIRDRGADYLAYALLDSEVDHYLPVLDALRGRIEALEEELIDGPPPDNTSRRIRDLRSSNLHLLRTVRGFQETVRLLGRFDLGMVDSNLRPYLRDLQDHLRLVVEGAELQRDRVMGLVELHSTQVAAELNDTMKILTVISTIFIPLTFLSGLYGMNFSFMPELQWRGGYFMLLGIMSVIAASLTLFFRYRKWF